MFSTPIHVIDFEGSRTSGIVEYGVVTVHGQIIESTVTRLCAPTGTISDADRMQHGISEESALGQAGFDSDWELFAALRESGPLCAHSASVEDGLLSAVWPYPRSSPDFLDEGSRVASWGPWIDTLSLYRRIYPQLGSHKLEDLVHLFGLKEALDERSGLYCPERRQRYHCALYDALASALLLTRLYHEPELEDISLRWLLMQSAAAESTRASMGQQELF